MTNHRKAGALLCAGVAAAIAAALAAAPGHAATTTKPVDCELVIAGETYIDGACAYRAEADGSFQIDGGDFFAQVQITGKNVAEAFWNEIPGSTHAQAPLGTVKRSGACWSNKNVKICARALSAAEERKALAAQPDGMMIYPHSAPPGPCIGVEGLLAEGATPVLHNCAIPADLIFDVAADGTLSINKHKDLCIGLESPGMAKPAQLVVLACQADSPKWRYVKSGESGVVQSAGGQCWTIPAMAGDPGTPFPYMITAETCATSPPETQDLDISED